MLDIDSSRQLYSLVCSVSDADQLGPDPKAGELTEKKAISLTLMDFESGLYYSHPSHGELALKQACWNKSNNNNKENSNSVINMKCYAKNHRNTVYIKDT